MQCAMCLKSEQIKSEPIKAFLFCNAVSHKPIFFKNMYINNYNLIFKNKLKKTYSNLKKKVFVISHA
jgi:hypothetical protein